MDEASDAELEQRLAWTVRKQAGGKISAVKRLLKYMHQERRIQPSLAHYEALILANTDPEGSAQSVRHILFKLRKSGLRYGALIDNAVLKVGRIELLPTPSS